MKWRRKRKREKGKKADKKRRRGNLMIIHVLQSKNYSKYEVFDLKGNWII